MKLSLYYKLLIFHVLLGVGVFIFRPIALLYFLFIIIFFINKIYNVSKKNKSFYVLLACAYIVGVEVFLRMNGGTISYEASKYLVILFVLMGLSSKGFSNQSLIYFFYILLLIPGVYVAVTQLGFETNIRKAIAFNLSGPVCLGVSAIFCYRRTVSFNQINMVLLAFALPLVSMAMYLMLYTPNLQDVVRGTGSNFAASGGFGPNQVSTVLGIGVFVMATRFFMSRESLVHKILDLGILGFMSFRAIVTFSRGGVLTAIAMILAFIGLYYLKVNLKTKFKIKTSFLVFLGLGMSVWLISSIQTNGLIENRYANEDARGRKKEDVTTGRSDLVGFEFEAFKENPFLGIGVGRVREERFNQTGVLAASHNEISRMVAEHGLFGVFALLILLLAPLIYRIRNRSNMFFYSFYLFWLLTINHSAMRIAAPAFIYALSLLNITYEKPTIHRKSIGSNG